MYSIFQFKIQVLLVINQLWFNKLNHLLSLAFIHIISIKNMFQMYDKLNVTHIH